MSESEGGTVLITGGAGFIGTNLATRLMSDGKRVRILDSLARPGVDRNVAYLRERFRDSLDFESGDVRDANVVDRAMFDVTEVYHLAAQVAVTTSLTSPLLDFEVNARGTLNVLESARRMRHPPALIFTSTNKVYGPLHDVPLQRSGRRYEPVAPDMRERGIDESRPLDFHSPYGCSKGAADQYVLDYARCFGLRTVVFRMSCIYGPHQLGTEDQGWVAHFLLKALAGDGVVIYGDGRQVRDVLFVDDLVNAFTTAMASVDRICGRAFNIGGGPKNVMSLLDLLDLLRDQHRITSRVQFGESRIGDQRYFVADTTRFTEATGWRPRVGVTEGVESLFRWFTSNPKRDVADNVAATQTQNRLPATSGQVGA